MRIRMKIGFMAYEQCYTIQELFLVKIMDSYKILKAKGLIKNPYPEMKKNKVMMNLLNGEGRIQDMVNENMKKNDIENNNNDRDKDYPSDSSSIDS